MKNHFLKIPLLILVTSLLFALALIHQRKANPKQPIYISNTTTDTLSKTHPKWPKDESRFFTRQLLPNRLPSFIKLLNQKGAFLKDLNDFRIKSRDWPFRKQLALQTGVNYSWIQIHSELANIMQCGMNDLDAQMLHFSHWNYQNSFTGAIMNLTTLSEANAESILIDLLGWQAGNYDPIVERYKVDFANIESWIAYAKLNSHPLSYSTD